MQKKCLPSTHFVGEIDWIATFQQRCDNTLLLARLSIHKDKLLGLKRKELFSSLRSFSSTPFSPAINRNLQWRNQSKSEAVSLSDDLTRHRMTTKTHVPSSSTSEMFRLFDGGNSIIEFVCVGDKNCYFALKITLTSCNAKIIIWM